MHGHPADSEREIKEGIPLAWYFLRLVQSADGVKGDGVGKTRSEKCTNYVPSQRVGTFSSWTLHKWVAG